MCARARAWAHVCFLEGTAYTFDSRTEIEKLTLTYFSSSERLALSSQAYEDP